MSQERKIQIVTALLDGTPWQNCGTVEELATIDVLEVMELVPAFMR